MRIYEHREGLSRLLFFIRWKLVPVLLATGGHTAFALRGLRDPRNGVWARLGLVCKTVRIHLEVPCPHAPLEALEIIEDILTLSPAMEGVCVECGTWVGGSTAKLSHAAAMTGRRLIVCDSFMGLPETQDVDDVEGMDPFETGTFSARLEQVRYNVNKYGTPKGVEYIAGWYNETLHQLKNTPIACLFLDVDLQSSIKDCLVALWNQVVPGCKVYVHDADRQPVVDPFQDEAWWNQNIGGKVPEFHGALTGLGWLKEKLGYARKRSEAPT